MFSPLRGLRRGFRGVSSVGGILLAAACEIAGQVEEGLTLLDDALRIVERTGERWFAAELNRHKGQLLRHRNQLVHPLAEGCVISDKQTQPDAGRQVPSQRRPRSITALPYFRSDAFFALAG